MRYDPERHHRRSIRRSGHDYRKGVYFVTITCHRRQALLAAIIDEVVCLTPAGAIAYDLWLSIPHHFPTVRLDAFVIMPDHMHGIVVLGQVAWWRGITGNPAIPFVLTPPVRFPAEWSCPACQSGAPLALVQRLRAESPPQASSTGAVPAPYGATPSTGAVPAPCNATVEMGTGAVPAPYEATPRMGAVPAPCSATSAVEMGTGAVPASPATTIIHTGQANPAPADSFTSRSRLEHPTLGQVIAYFKYQTTKLCNQLRLTPGAEVWHRNYHERTLYSTTELNAFRAYILKNPYPQETLDNFFEEVEPPCG